MIRSIRGPWVAAAVTMALSLSAIAARAADDDAPSDDVMNFELSSPAFRDGELLAPEHTCEGKDISPELVWTTAPEGTESFALLVEDPDAPIGVWTHWVVYNIPGDARSLDEAMAKRGELSDGTRQGKNDFNRDGYNGPCPPGGSRHHYVFTVFALDTKLKLRPGATNTKLRQAMKGHILAQAERTALYERKF